MSHYCHTPCACHDISALIDLIPTHPFVCHYHDVGSYPCDSPYDPKPPDIISVSPESDWILETWPTAALQYICSWRLGLDFGIMFHSYLPSVSYFRGLAPHFILLPPYYLNPHVLCLSSPVYWIELSTGLYSFPLLNLRVLLLSILKSL
jgi:hypothetical protein